MKKILIALIILVGFIGFKPAKAQFETFGGGIVLATGGEYKYDGLPYYNRSFGIDLRAVYNYNKKIQIVPDLKYYLPKTDDSFNNGESKTTMYAFNLNAHYILNSRSRDNYRVYLLAGAHVSGWNIKDDHIEITRTVDINEFKFFPGANVGAGMQFPFDAGFIFFAEVKYTVSKAGQLAFTPGILFYL